LFLDLLEEEGPVVLPERGTGRVVEDLLLLGVVEFTVSQFQLLDFWGIENAMAGNWKACF
jgi:hypothetical protein